jgi:hypothetical protein
VRMRAGAVAGDQRIEQFGDAARLCLGLGRLAQGMILAVAGRWRPSQWNYSDRS